MTIPDLLSDREMRKQPNSADDDQANQEML